MKVHFAKRSHLSVPLAQMDGSFSHLHIIIVSGKGGFLMTIAAELLHSLVPISQFNKGQAAKIDNV